MALLSTLGDFVFVVFHRPEDRGAPPAMLAREIETIQRPGVDGTGFILTGIKQQPFQMRSGVDCTTYAAANNVAAAYHLSQGTGPHNLTWGGVDYSGFNVQFVVLKVEILKIRRIRGAVGGVNTNPQAWIEALWTLQTVFANQPADED